MIASTQPASSPDAFDGPVLLNAEHDRAGFACGEPALDVWFRGRALRNHVDGASRSYVVCVSGTNQVAGFFCLSAATIARTAAPGSVRRNMPDPIPAILLGRLATDVQFQGRGVGGGLLREAIAETLTTSERVGVRVLLVHALSDAAAAFYKRAGFLRSPVGERTLMLPLAAARRAAADPPAG